MRPPLVGDRRHDPLVVEPERPVSPIDDPAVQIRIDPVADRSIEVRSEQARLSGAVGRPDDDARDHVVERLRLEQAAGRDPASVGRPRRMARPARSEHLARLGAALIDIDRPDRRPPVEVGLRTAIGGERDRSAVGMPRDVRDAPVAARDLARPGRPRIDDKEVRPSVSMALLVPSPVGAGDVAGDGGLIRARLPAPRDRPGLAGDEAGRVDLGGEREAPAVGRPGDLADRAMLAHLRGSRVGRASEVHDHDRRDRVVVGRVGPDEGERVAVRTQPRPRVADRPAGQLARRGDGAPGPQIDREQVADIAVALDRFAARRRQSARRRTGRALRRRRCGGCPLGSWAGVQPCATD